MRRRFRCAVVGAVVAAAAGAATPGLTPVSAGTATSPDSRSNSELPITRAGSWLVDSSGRVVVLHGFDIVRKTAPWLPTHFSAQDAAFLRSEGFNAARIGMAWTAVEPKPGVYDDAYIRKFVAFERLLGDYGIRALIDFHQDLWSSQNMPAWATLGSSFTDDFQHFWDNDPAPDGVGIQTHYIKMWQHVAGFFRGDPNVIAIDPFNEPQPGYKSGCGPYTQCPQFDSGALSAFYAAFTAAIRKVDTQHVILVEPLANNNLTAPTLNLPRDPRVGTTFHEYCNITQTATSNGPLDSLCQPIDQQGLDTQTNYARKANDVPTFVGEFSSNDADDDNATMVDLMGSRFLSWTMWMYYTASTDPANTPGQGLLINDGKPGSEANAKQAKLDAAAVPYATAIAGTPQSSSFDRATHTYRLTYSTAALPGATLTDHTTTVFLPRRDYPGDAAVSAQHATYRLVGSELDITPTAGATSVTVTVKR